VTAHSHLVTCPSCARHVRASESVCPFCATVVPEATRSTKPRRPPTERLNRSALYAFGVGGSLAVVAACGGATITGTEGDSGTDDGGVTMNSSYGTSTFAAFDGGSDGGVTMNSTAYGSSTFTAFDAGASNSSGDAAVDASADVGPEDADTTLDAETADGV
jgi:hypothetical protein